MTEEFGLSHGGDIPWEVWRRFSGRLGYGDGVTEPAATLDDLIDPLEEVFAAARDHDECPEWCDEDEQWERPRSCGTCHGSGCLPNAELAYLECPDCAGDGRDHAEYRLSGPRDPGTVLIEAPSVNHKGPYDTDASMFRGAADKLRRGYEPGGGNVKEAIAKLLVRVADALDRQAS